ncbi:MAG TPA: FCD domain-containing protein [Dehalococcoidia bacterium]|nr:FCD domain-containing protein [Dehalococcoidia bacterium]
MVRPNAFTPGGNVPRPRKMPELVAWQIADDITSQGIEAGDVLPPERELTAAYGVSRGTLREALRILESYGLISVKSGPSGGPTVQPFRFDAMIGPLSIFMKIRGTPLSEVIEGRLALEPVMARFVAMNAGDADLAELERLVDGMDTEVEDETKFRQYNRLFHEGVARMSGNFVLECFACTLSGIIDGHKAGVRYSTARRKAINASHRRLLEAIRDRNGESAAAEARSHVEEFHMYLQRRFPNLLVGPVRDVARFQQ